MALLWWVSSVVGGWVEGCFWWLWNKPFFKKKRKHKLPLLLRKTKNTQRHSRTFDCPACQRGSAFASECPASNKTNGNLKKFIPRDQKWNTSETNHRIAFFFFCCCCFSKDFIDSREKLVARVDGVLYLISDPVLGENLCFRSATDRPDDPVQPPAACRASALTPCSRLLLAHLQVQVFCGNFYLACFSLSWN